MSETIAVHVRYESLYISLQNNNVKWPSSASTEPGRRRLIFQQQQTDTIYIPDTIK